MLIRSTFALAAATAAFPTPAADLTLKVQLPRMDIAEYHRPYLAAWIEKASDQTYAGTIALWYDLRKRDNGGAKWLKDMRQWWRKSGRDVQMPVDGVSAATRAPGEHAIGLDVKALPAGSYQLVIEAARENGGREVLHLPFDWPVKTAQTVKAQGEHELGAVALELKP